MFSNGLSNSVINIILSSLSFLCVGIIRPFRCQYPSKSRRSTSKLSIFHKFYRHSLNRHKNLDDLARRGASFLAKFLKLLIILLAEP